MHNHLRNLLLVVCLLFAAGTLAQTSVHDWRSIHKVKKQETVFGIAKDYNVTIEELLDANPDLKQPGATIKKGDWILVPFAKKGDKAADKKKAGQELLQDLKNNPVKPGAIKIGFMLPFHREDADGDRMVEYYQGMRLALDSLAKRGINAEINVWNVAKDSSIVKVLQDPRAHTLDVIYGPLYSAQLPQLATFCKTNNIKLFIPFSISSAALADNPQVMQVYQTAQQLNERSVDAFVERFGKSHQPIIIDCHNPADRKAEFTAALRMKLISINNGPKLTNINTPMSEFAKQFSRKKPNVIVLNTARSPELNRVYQKLDSLTKQVPGIAIAMYGYNEWFMYQKHDLAYFFKYNTYIPTTYYYNAAAGRTESFERDFRARWKDSMMAECTPRMGLMGYDHTMYLVQGIHKYGKAFVGSPDQSSYKALQTPLKFKQTQEGGGYQNQTFQLIHFRTDQRLESLSD